MANEKAEKRKSEKRSAPPSVDDPAPSWTKRTRLDEAANKQVELPTASYDRQWYKSIDHPVGDLVTIAKGWATAFIALVEQQCPTFSNKDVVVVRRSATTEVWTKRWFKKHEIILAPVGSAVKDAYWTRGGPCC